VTARHALIPDETHLNPHPALLVVYFSSIDPVSSSVLLRLFLSSVGDRRPTTTMEATAAVGTTARLLTGKSRFFACLDKLFD
jgi:hypothetical protein